MQVIGCNHEAEEIDPIQFDRASKRPANEGVGLRGWTQEKPRLKAPGGDEIETFGLKEPYRSSHSALLRTEHGQHFSRHDRR
jgi:hypothetical protein